MTWVEGPSNLATPTVHQSNEIMEEKLLVLEPSARFTMRTYWFIGLLTMILINESGS